MTTRDRHMTPKEEKEYFEQALTNAVELGVVPDNPTILARSVFEAIISVADSYPETKPELIKAARKAYSDYLAWRAEL